MISLLLPDGLEKDLENLVALNADQLGLLEKFLNSEEGGKRTYDAGRACAQAIGRPPYECFRLLVLVSWLKSEKDDLDKNEAELVDELIEAFPDCEAKLANNKDLFVALFRQAPVADGAKKKRKLEQGPLKTLRSIWGVCDLRPVFDADRERIVDSIPIVTARAITEDDRGDEDVLVFQLNAESLEKLEKFLAVTKEKLVALESIEVSHD